MRTFTYNHLIKIDCSDDFFIYNSHNFYNLTRSLINKEENNVYFDGYRTMQPNTYQYHQIPMKYPLPMYALQNTTQ